MIPFYVGYNLKYTDLSISVQIEILNSIRFFHRREKQEEVSVTPNSEDSIEKTKFSHRVIV